MKMSAEQGFVSQPCTRNLPLTVMSVALSKVEIASLMAHSPTNHERGIRFRSNLRCTQACLTRYNDGKELEYAFTINRMYIRHLL